MTLLKMRSLITKLRSWAGSTWARRIIRALLGLTIILLLLATVTLVQAWESLGTSAQDARLARMEQSPQWQDGAFENPEPLWNDYWGMFTELTEVSPHVEPEDDLPIVQTDPDALQTVPASGLRVTWLGHSTTLIEVDGVRVLTDPV